MTIRHPRPDRGSHKIEQESPSGLSCFAYRPWKRGVVEVLHQWSGGVRRAVSLLEHNLTQVSANTCKSIDFPDPRAAFVRLFDTPLSKLDVHEVFELKAEDTILSDCRRNYSRAIKKHRIRGG